MAQKGDVGLSREMGGSVWQWGLIGRCGAVGLSREMSGSVGRYGAK
jgi:hypothetical protein